MELEPGEIVESDSDSTTQKEVTSAEEKSQSTQTGEDKSFLLEVATLASKEKRALLQDVSKATQPSLSLSKPTLQAVTDVATLPAGDSRPPARRSSVEKYSLCQDKPRRRSSPSARRRSGGGSSSDSGSPYIDRSRRRHREERRRRTSPHEAYHRRKVGRDRSRSRSRSRGRLRHHHVTDGGKRRPNGGSTSSWKLPGYCYDFLRHGR